MQFRRSIAVTAAIAAGLFLAGCSSEPPPPDGDTVPSPTQEAPPSYVPNGTAADNQPWFDQVNLETLAQNSQASSQEMVNALVAAGFDKAAMEVTFDRTNVDLEADYLIVSVKIGDECLVGQRSNRGYSSEIVPPLGTGKCLIGETQPITW